MKTNNQKRVIDDLKSAGIDAIIPTEEWEILGNHNNLPNSIKMSNETVSLPVYPLLSDSDIDIIISTVVGK